MTQVGQDKREALSTILRLVRLLLSVAAGTIVLSGTLLQTVYVGHSLSLLIIAWILLGASLLFGYGVHGRYISQLDNSNLQSSGPIEWLGLLQFVLALVGLVFFGIFVVKNVTSGPRLDTTRVELNRGARFVTVTVDCRSGSDSGCRGEVVLYPARGKRPHEIGHALFAEEADGPLKVRVPLTRAEGRALTKGRAKKLKVETHATGRFGNQTTAASELRLRRSLHGRCGRSGRCRG